MDELERQLLIAVASGGATVTNRATGERRTVAFGAALFPSSERLTVDDVARVYTAIMYGGTGDAAPEELEPPYAPRDRDALVWLMLRSYDRTVQERAAWYLEGKSRNVTEYDQDVVASVACLHHMFMTDVVRVNAWRNGAAELAVGQHDDDDDEGGEQVTVRIDLEIGPEDGADFVAADKYVRELAALEFIG